MAFSGYSLNNVPLHEGHGLNQWRILRDGTQTQGGITNSLTKIPAPLRPGYIPAPFTFTEQVIVFVVRTPRSRLEELMALCDACVIVSRTDDPYKYANCQVVSAIPNGDEPFDGMFDVTITLSLFQGVWRDVNEQTFGPFAMPTLSQTFTMFDGITAPINDAKIWIGGSFNTFVLTDSGGSQLKTVNVPPGGPLSFQGVLFHGSTGRAFMSQAADPWTPLYDATSVIDVSANGGFRITPALVSGNPKVRRASLRLDVYAGFGVTMLVRGKGNYRSN